MQRWPLYKRKLSIEYSIGKVFQRSIKSLSRLIGKINILEENLAKRICPKRKNERSELKTNFHIVEVSFYKISIAN